ncbi:MAG: YicC/YloC family endoribonuclease [Candidatus Omnitrophota bacterium]|nr:YicC/YloC family endoribonuclease [Candidatus Omnitrophota bacterium]
MIRGMTGFGRQGFAKSQVKGFIELRSLNHKYFDVVFHLPPGFGSFEEKLKHLVHKEMLRGRATISLVFTSKPEKIYVRKEVARNYLKSLKSLHKTLHLKSDLGLSNIITLPGVIHCEEGQSSPETLWPAVERSAKKALGHLIKMRQLEGRALYQDISDKIRKIRKAITHIPRRAKEIIASKRRVASNEEFSSFLKSSDINEELTRFSYHLKNLQAKLNSSGGMGKELDFIAQELQREINTISAKLLDKTTSESTIKIKSLIEKIREQLQNVE